MILNLIIIKGIIGNTSNLEEQTIFLKRVFSALLLRGQTEVPVKHFA